MENNKIGVEIRITPGTRAMTKDYIGTIYSMVPESAFKQYGMEKDLNEFGRFISNIKEEDKETRVSTIEIPEEIIKEVLKNSCDIVLKSEEEIKTIFAMLNAYDKNDQAQLVKELKEEIEKAVKKVMQKGMRRKTVLTGVEGFINKLKTQFKAISNMKQNEKEEMEKMEARI